MTKERIEELKKTHGDIYQGTVSWRDEEAQEHRVEFIHKKPGFSDYEAFQQDAQKLSPAAANQNLVASLILDPPSGQVLEELNKAPLALDQWLMKNILPFFGGEVVEAKSRKL